MGREEWQKLRAVGRRLVWEVRETCPTCGGTGSVPTTRGGRFRICWRCQQTGIIIKDRLDITDEYAALVDSVGALLQK